jgi:hypothetical protein
MGIDLFDRLDNTVDHLQVIGRGQAAEFLQPGLLPPPGARADGRKDRFLGFQDGSAGNSPPELVFKTLDKLEKIYIQAARVGHACYGPVFSIFGPRQDMRETNLPREARFVDVYARDHIQRQQGHIGQIFFRKVFAGQVGMNASQALQPPAAASEAGRIRDVDMFFVARNDPGDLPLAGQEDGELPVEFPGQGCEPSGQFLGNNVIRRDPSPVKPLEASLLAGFQPARFAEYLFDRLLLYGYACLMRVEERQRYNPGKA